MRIIVCGSRDFDDEKAVESAVDEAVMPTAKFGTINVTLVHGAARGADSCAAALVARAAGGRMYRLYEEAHPANWSIGKKAGPLRNGHMAELGADLCLAFWDGFSRGTEDMIRQATQHGIAVRVVPWKRTG